MVAAFPTARSGGHQETGQGTLEYSASGGDVTGVPSGSHPRHGYRQRSSQAANTKGRGDAEMSTWDESVATNDRLWWQEMGRILAVDVLFTVIFLTTTHICFTIIY
uniref:Uncharacterized protein n=1 Tax=Oryza punctata TaxID=4537 RepID=A0A0E0JGJ1_ORYPU